MKTYSYACKDYPGMEKCPGHFFAATEDEVWKLIEVHSTVAHGEDPATWNAETKDYLKRLIRMAQ
jgi:hypothetical protein